MCIAGVCRLTFRGFRVGTICFIGLGNMAKNKIKFFSQNNWLIQHPNILFIPSASHLLVQQWKHSLIWPGGSWSEAIGPTPHVVSSPWTDNGQVAFGAKARVKVRGEPVMQQSKHQLGRWHHAGQDWRPLWSGVEIYGDTDHSEMLWPTYHLKYELHTRFSEM